jgi:hypothetical protein
LKNNNVVMKYSFRMSKNHVIFVTMVTLIVARFPVHSQGIMLVQHLGAHDPQSEGFSLMSYGQPTLDPVTNDMGMSAWSITMTSSDAAQYYQTLTAQQTALLLGGSWDLSLDLRVLNAPVTPTYDVSAQIITGPQQFSLKFGMETNGDPTIQVQGSSLSPVFVVNGAGSTYNDYQLIYDAGVGSASLWINGSERLSGIVPGVLDATLGSVSWSGYQHAYNVGANWNEVSLVVTPEPSAASVLCLGSGVLLYLQRKYRRKI